MQLFTCLFKKFVQKVENTNSGLILRRLQRRLRLRSKWPCSEGGHKILYWRSFAADVGVSGAHSGAAYVVAELRQRHPHRRGPQVDPPLGVGAVEVDSQQRQVGEWLKARAVWSSSRRTDLEAQTKPPPVGLELAKFRTLIKVLNIL